MNKPSPEGKKIIKVAGKKYGVQYWLDLFSPERYGKWGGGAASPRHIETDHETLLMARRPARREEEPQE